MAECNWFLAQKLFCHSWSIILVWEINANRNRAAVDLFSWIKRDGFFIECGALDGETRSNSLFFERFRGWTGLLIEADPVNYQQMVSKNRRAYMVPSCLSPTPHPKQACVPGLIITKPSWYNIISFKIWLPR